MQSLPPPDCSLAVMVFPAVSNLIKQVPMDLQSVCTASPKAAALLIPWTESYLLNPSLNAYRCNGKVASIPSFLAPGEDTDVVVAVDRGRQGAGTRGRVAVGHHGGGGGGSESVRPPGTVTECLKSNC